MITKTIEVRHTVEVTVDETKIDSAFMDEFRKHFYNFADLDDHMRHIASSEVIGAIRGFPEFLEGYGEIKELGISIDNLGFETEIWDD